MISVRLPLLLAVGACATAGYLMWSGPEERIAKLARDGRTGEAALAAEKILRQGQATPLLLTTLTRVYETGGEPVRAAELLEVYALARPPDPNILSWLARIYASFGHNAGVTETLTRLVDVQPSRETVAELLALLRLNGRFEEEFATLDRFAESGLLHVRDLERLTLQLMQQGRSGRAAEILRRTDGRFGDLDERMRRLLFEALVEERAYAEAAQRAEAWLAAWRKPWLAAPLVLRLAAVAPAETTLGLARATTALFPEIRFYLAKALAEQGHGRVAKALLADWPRPEVALTEKEIGGYVAAAAATGDAALLGRAIAALRAGADPEAQANLAEAVAGTYGLERLAAMWPDLPANVLLRRPLLGVRMARLTKRETLVRWLVANADLGALRANEQIAWLRVLRAESGAFAAFDILTRHERRGELPAGFHASYRALAAEVGRLDSTRRELASLGSVAQLAR